MDINQFTHFIFFSMILVITRSLPIANPDLEDLSRIASQPCVADGQQSYEPSPAMVAAVSDQRNASENERPHLLTLLTPEVEELVAQANNTYNNIKHWMSAFVGLDISNLTKFVKSTLNVTLVQHTGLTANEMPVLHILEQFSTYVLFLKKLENDSASVNGRATLRDLRLKTMQPACTLRRLLQPVSDEIIATFARQDLVDRIITLTNQRAGIKRLVCCIAVDTMLNMFSRIQVSVSEGSVILRSN